MSKNGRDEKGIREKFVNVLREMRQIDKKRHLTYKSENVLIEGLVGYLPDVKLQRGVESLSLQSTLCSLNLLKPLEDGTFSDPLVEKMYEKLKKPSSDILLTSYITHTSTYGMAGQSKIEEY